MGAVTIETMKIHWYRIIYTHEYLYSTLLSIKVFLVTGGHGSKLLSSTEIYRQGNKAWTVAGNLPKAVFGIRGVSFDNKIIMTGKTTSNLAL